MGGNFNDDPLWLIQSTSAYIRETGDFAILDESVPFQNDASLSASLSMSSWAKRRLYCLPDWLSMAETTQYIALLRGINVGRAKRVAMAYLWCADGILESRLLPAFSRSTSNEATTRNWATVLRIQAVASSS